jgi:uncharacterized protein involved in exopolysaccharide biosynthesis
LVLFAVLRRNKLILFVPALAVLGIAAAVAWFLPRKYESQAIVRMERTEILGEQAEKGLSVFADERLRLINYRVLTQERLQELIGRFGLYGETKAERLSGDLEGMMRDDIRVTPVNINAAAPGQGQAGYADIVFSVAYLGETPETARRVADALAALYLDDDIRIRERQWIEARDVMEAALFDAREKVVSAEERVVQYRLENLESMSEYANANLQAMEEMDRRIEQALEDVRVLKEREYSLQDKLDTVSPNNPLYDPLVKSLGAVRSKMGAMDRVIQGMRKKSIALRRRIEDAPDVEREYKALEAERDALQGEYDRLLSKAADDAAALELEKSGRGERYSIVEAARLPKRPSSPNVPAILLAGLAAGLCVGVALVMWKSSRDGALRSFEQAASALPYPVLAAIPALDAPNEVRRRNIGGILLKGAILCAIVCLILFRVLWWPR